MFGMRHSCGPQFEGKWAARRGWRGHLGPGHGWGGRHGMGGGEMMRAGRMLAQGDLRLIALALIAEQPRHGYDLKKRLSETLGPLWGISFGSLYPALRRLERSGAIAEVDENATTPPARCSRGIEASLL